MRMDVLAPDPQAGLHPKVSVVVPVLKTQRGKNEAKLVSRH
jgi:hypothetical protein